LFAKLVPAAILVVRAAIWWTLLGGGYFPPTISLVVFLTDPLYLLVHTPGYIPQFV